MNEIDNKKIDPILLGILLCMSFVSLIAIYSALPLINSNVGGNTILIKQLAWYILGYGVLFALFKMGSERLENTIYILYFVLLFLLALLLFQKYVGLPFLDYFIVPRNNSYTWYTLPGIGTIQPSEFMKIVLIILVPKIIENHHKTYPLSSMKTDLYLVLDVMKYVLPACALIYPQPDSGLVLIILVSVVFMLIASGIHREWLYIGFGTVALIIFIVFIISLIDYDFVVKYIIGGEYKIGRINGWLNPEKYILTWGNQLYTSLMAIGSAGFFGHGLQNVPVYIAESQTDFIYAIIGSSFGLAGSLSVLILSLSLDLRLVQIGLRTRKGRNKYIIAGLVGILAFQQIENMGMITGLFPITGITLPFVSAGGSSLLSYMIIIALVMQMYNDTEKQAETFKKEAITK